MNHNSFEYVFTYMNSHYDAQTMHLFVCTARGNKSLKEQIYTINFNFSLDSLVLKGGKFSQDDFFAASEKVSFMSFLFDFLWLLVGMKINFIAMLKMFVCL